MSLMKRNQGLLSIEIRPDGVAVAYSPKTSSSNISFCEFNKISGDIKSNINEFRSYIAKIVAKNNLKKSNCVLILHPDYYRITLVNTPHAC